MHTPLSNFYSNSMHIFIQRQKQAQLSLLIKFQNLKLTICEFDLIVLALFSINKNLFFDITANRKKKSSKNILGKKKIVTFFFFLWDYIVKMKHKVSISYLCMATLPSTFISQNSSLQSLTYYTVFNKRNQRYLPVFQNRII